MDIADWPAKGQEFTSQNHWCGHWDWQKGQCLPPTQGSATSKAHCGKAYEAPAEANVLMTDLPSLS